MTSSDDRPPQAPEPVPLPGRSNLQGTALTDLCEAQSLALWLLTEWNRTGQYDGQAVYGARQSVRALNRGLIEPALTFLRACSASMSRFDGPFDAQQWDQLSSASWNAFKALKLALGEPIED